MRSPVERARILELAAAGVNDCEIARRTGVPRRTVRDIRSGASRQGPRSFGALCPRCWRPARAAFAWSADRYAELLGFYLGDGYICRMSRTYRLRVSLDAAYPRVVRRVDALLAATFVGNPVTHTIADGGSTVVVGVYSGHLPCLFPQVGPGKKHERPIELEGWQWASVKQHPWAFLRGCLWSDGCAFINRTGRYAYPSWTFDNRSADILKLFSDTCRLVGVEHRVNATSARIYRRASVALIDKYVGQKRSM